MNRTSTSLEALFEKRLEDVHTCIPAKVESVDYSTGYITAKPLLKARYSLNKYTEYPTIGDIPPMYPNDGYNASITMPIKVGATVNIFFSERDPSSALEGDGTAITVSDFNRVLGLYPVGWMTISTVSRSKSFSAEDIEIINDKMKVIVKPESMVAQNNNGTITLSEDGTITQENSSASTTVSSSGAVSLTNQGGSISLSPDGSMSLTGGSASISTSPDGTITINGLTITPDGNLITATGTDVNTHFHSGVQSGTSNTGAPV